MCSILGFCGPGGDYGAIREALSQTASRGPDQTRLLKLDNGWLGFNRLSIMGLTPEGMQPFLYSDKATVSCAETPEEEGCLTAPENTQTALVCNGEIYGFRPLRDRLVSDGFRFISDSDCEILPALYEEYGTDMFRMLDAEYALVLYDAKENSFVAARDPVGIRPLYFGVTKDGTYVFASEPKNLLTLVGRIHPFPPGHYFKDGEFVKYRDMSVVEHPSDDDMETALQKIHDLLIEGVKKRLDSDTPVGFLLSGGLDSSLVCGIAASLTDKPLKTWAIGMDVDAIDLKYAREVADYIHSDHHEVIISKEDVIGAVDEVVRLLGTWDITTVRASIGMYLVCKKIHETSDVRVIMTGEISDEIFGYK